MADYDLSKPWNLGVQGSQVLPLINDDHPTIRVEAGPGTGKTFGLTRRIVRALHPQGQGLTGDRCLVAAFNRVIAKDLASEIDTALRAAGVDERPCVYTVHGLCLRVLGAGVRLLMSHERDAMLYDLRTRHPDAFGEIGVAQLDQMLRDDEAGHVPHQALRTATANWLADHEAMLISDLPRRLKESLQGGGFADERYDLVMVDEYQDLTEAEQQLMQRLRAADGQLIALGDRLQSIYAFRGNHRLGLSSLDDFGPVHDIQMTECQRCPGTVVSAANVLVALEGSEMQAVSEEPGTIHVVHWGTPGSEAEGMAQRIFENVQRHPEDRHLAMVTRRAFGFDLHEKLKALDPNLPMDLSFAEGILERWPVREAFLAFTLSVAPDRPSWRAWLGYQNPGAEKSPLAPSRNSDAYLRFAAAHGYDIRSEHLEQLVAEARTMSRGSGGANLWDRASRLVELRPHLTTGSAEDIVSKSFAPETWDVEHDLLCTRDLALLRNAAMELLNEARSENPGAGDAEWLRRVADELRYQIAVREPLDEGSGVSLKIATLWGSKGLTADHVYVIGLCDEALPGLRTNDYPGSETDFYDEQRRLFYVSLTRAKQTLVLSRPTRVKPGDAKRLKLEGGVHRRHWVELAVSRFVRELLASGGIPDSMEGAEWPGC